MCVFLSFNNSRFTLERSSAGESETQLALSYNKMQVAAGEPQEEI